MFWSVVVDIDQVKMELNWEWYVASILQQGKQGHGQALVWLLRNNPSFLNYIRCRVE